MNTVKSLFFFFLAFFCFSIKEVKAEEFFMPTLKVIPTQKNQEHDYCIIIDNVQKKERFSCFFQKMHYRDVGKLEIDESSKFTPLNSTENLGTIFIHIKSENFLPGEGVICGCVHFEKGLAKKIFFIPKPTLEEEAFTVKTESNPIVLESYYEKLKNQPSRCSIDFSTADKIVSLDFQMNLHESLDNSNGFKSEGSGSITNEFIP